MSIDEELATENGIKIIQVSSAGQVLKNRLRFWLVNKMVDHLINISKTTRYLNYVNFTTLRVSLFFINEMILNFLNCI